MPKNLEEKFKLFCDTKNLNLNQNQILTIKKLQDFYESNFSSSILDFLKKKEIKRGFYLRGGVGVGKTMILDFLQVTNIVDAMILGKLFDKIFNENIKVLITSNIKISELYKDGLQRDQFKPFIEIMKKRTIEYELIIEDDYRKSKDNQNDRYFFPLNDETNFKMNKYFRIISKDKKKINKILNIKGRDFHIKEFYEGIVRFTFNELCDQNLGAEDYLEIIKVSEFIFIDKIPQFDDINSNQQHRFITLIDIVYDKKIPIAVSAEKSLDEFNSSKSLKEPFKRTISRLYELTSSNFKL